MWLPLGLLSLCLSPLPILSSPSLKSQACQQLLWTLPSPLVAFRANRTTYVMDVSTNQGSGMEHRNHLCFCDLYDRATSPPLKCSLL
uniref:WLPL514 n=1 Tax=Homo sapiens TaxID=9606 RepID=Q6UWZ0_HUMAN|nr:WLPL514 [Homo sapiens]